MPIFEYRCADCKRKVSVFYRTISAVDHATARCNYCGSARLSRLVSRVRVIRGGKSGDEAASSEGADDLPPDLAGVDENDPRSLGRFLRKMASESGEEMGPEFDEVVGRLEKGEDPEKIEQSMGDVFGEPPGDMPGMDDDYGMTPPEPPAAEESDKTKHDQEGKDGQAATKNPRRQVVVSKKPKRAPASKPKAKRRAKRA